VSDQSKSRGTAKRRVMFLLSEATFGALEKIPFRRQNPFGPGNARSKSEFVDDAVRLQALNPEMLLLKDAEIVRLQEEVRKAKERLRAKEGAEQRAARLARQVSGLKDQVHVLEEEVIALEVRNREALRTAGQQLFKKVREVHAPDAPDGVWLRNFRESLHLTQEQLAKLMGADQSWVSQQEARSDAEISPKFYAKLYRLLCDVVLNEGAPR
jgi:DNA-binding transcriptional regulator YiaG